ncbi:MAG: hypothetical protein LBK72_01015, partial [Bifidobacteriaceae bacterium]|nr:hypothetical protein [Bifidobacteriaceae bacterium]
MTATLEPQGTAHEDVRRWIGARSALDASREQVEHLAGSPAVTSFHQKLDLLERRLVADPRAFRDLFIADGMAAVAAEFRGGELSAEFTERLWDMLLRNDDMSTVLLRFLWNLPVGKKRAFVRALDTHLSERYPMFAGLSVDWPAGNTIPPYIRTPEARSTDFELVNKGYLGYMDLGYSVREVELLVWLEALRDKQCAESPCELGVFL